MLAGFRTSSGKVVEAGMKGFCEYAGSIALQGIGLQGITCVWAHQLFLAWPQTPAPMPAITPSQTGCCSYAEPLFCPTKLCCCLLVHCLCPCRVPVCQHLLPAQGRQASTCKVALKWRNLGHTLSAALHQACTDCAGHRRSSLGLLHIVQSLARHCLAVLQWLARK